MLTPPTFVDGSSTRAVGQYARLYDHTGTQQAVADIIDSQTGEIDHEATALASDALGVGTFALTDIRDSKDYLVRRLADGNCWMVQNLDLELADFAGHNLNNTEDKNKVLTPDNTDLADSGRTYWDPSESTGGISNWGTWSLNNLGMAQAAQFQSYNLLSIYWNTKCSTTGNCDLENTTTNILTQVPRSYSNMVTSNNTTDFSSATNFRYMATNWATGFTSNQTKDPENDYPSSTPTTYDLPYTLSTATYIPAARATSETGSATIGVEYRSNATGSYYGNMYFGHFYNWYASTAESGEYATIDDAGDSICPSGWRLPQVSRGAVSDTYNLAAKIYKIYENNGEQTTDNTPQHSPYGPATDLLKLPISYNYNGVYLGQNGNSYNIGGGAYYWSASADNTTNGLGLVFYKGTANARYSASKTNGRSIRCVAHGNEIQSEESQQAVATTCSGGKICYDGNGGSGEMNDQSASANSSVVLTAPTFTRLGYSFAGWSSQDNGFGTVYGPNETITTPSNLATTGLQLYAKWLPSTGTMQDFTTAQCNALGTHQSVALTDNRDGNTYTVTKLKDGNCWMTTNLALNLADFAGDNPTKGYLTTANTDIGNDKDGSGNPTRTDLIDITSTNGGNSGLYRWDPSKSMFDRAVSIVQADPTKLPEGDTEVTMDNYFSIASLERLGNIQTAQFQSGDQYGSDWNWGSRLNESGETLYSTDGNQTVVNKDQGANTWYQNNGFWVTDNSRTQMPRSYTDGNNSYGAYYNFYAVTAESGEWGVIGTASDSLCPSGWHLPVDGDSSTDNSYTKLLSNADTYALSDNADSLKFIRTLPFSFLYSGYYHATGTFGSVSVRGLFTTATATADKNRRNLSLSTTSLGIEGNYAKIHGLSARCLLK